MEWCNQRYLELLSRCLKVALDDTNELTPLYLNTFIYILISRKYWINDFYYDKYDPGKWFELLRLLPKQNKVSLSAAVGDSITVNSYWYLSEEIAVFLGFMYGKARKYWKCRKIIFFLSFTIFLCLWLIIIWIITTSVQIEHVVLWWTFWHGYKRRLLFFSVSIIYWSSV